MTRRAAALFGAALLIGGCQSGVPHALVVFAASSLTKTFTALGGAFTDAGSGVGVEFSFAGSADLLSQLTQGAQADVFAAADTATMDHAVRAGLLDGAPQSFATNTMTIVVAPGNPKGVNSFRDLPRVSTVVCAVQVPCGAALPRLQSRAGVQLHPDSEESSVADVMNKVTSGQADAGLVYVTDARAAGAKVSSVALPEATVNTYQIAVLRSSRDRALARRFVDLVTGTDGRQVLAAAGFGPPSR